MKTANEKRKAFRENLRSGRFMIAPGIYDALSAKVAQAAGLPCLAPRRTRCRASVAL